MTGAAETVDGRAGGAPRSRRIGAFLFLGTALWGTSLGLWGVALPFRFEQLGIPVVQYGVALGAFAAGMLVTEPIWGVFAVHIARPGRIGLVGLVVCASVLGMGLATTFIGFTVALTALGASGVYLAPLQRWVALTYQGLGTEGRGTGRWNSAAGFGLAVGAASGALAYVEVGFFVLALICVACLAGGVVAAMALPWGDTPLPPPGLAVRATVGRLLSRPFLLCLVLVGLTFVAYSLPSSFLQYYSTVLFGGTPSEAGYVLGVGRLVAIVAAFLFGSVVDRWGPDRSVPAGFALVLAGTLGTWASATYAEMTAATLVFFAGYGWLTVSLLPLALRALPERDQGTAIGVFGSFEDAGILVGPLLLGATWAAYGPRSIFPVVAGLAVIGVLASWVAAYGPRSASTLSPARNSPGGPSR